MSKNAVCASLVLSPVAYSHSCRPSFSRRHRSDGSSHGNRRWKRRHSPGRDHSCAPFLSSRCFFPGHWVLTTAAPVTPLTPAVSGLPSPETVLIPVWLCKYKWCGNGGLAAWTDSMQATVRPAGWSDSTWWARASEGIWVKGLVRPTARLQFLKFFYPKRVSLNRERTFFFLMPCFSSVQLPELTPKIPPTTNTFILLTSKQHHWSNWGWYALLESTSTAFAESWESSFVTQSLPSALGNKNLFNL